MVRSKNKNTPKFSPNITVDSELRIKDDWIIVKKQKINIIIPRLPDNELSMEPNTEQDQLHGSSNSIINTPKFPQNQPSDLQVAEINDGLICRSPVLNIQSNQNILPSLDSTEAIINPRNPELRKVPAFPRKTKCRIRTSIRSGLSGVSNFYSSTMDVNNNIRALNLERNISSAGGLSRWLSSLGLERFEQLFHGKNVCKYYLVNLSMKKLKDMGVCAVGPRRKLIHAIESSSKAYYRKTSKNFVHKYSLCSL